MNEMICDKSKAKSLLKHSEKQMFYTSGLVLFFLYNIWTKWLYSHRTDMFTLLCLCMLPPFFCRFNNITFLLTILNATRTALHFQIILRHLQAAL